KFRLNVLGQSFRNSPDVFQAAQKELANEIDQWGFLEAINDYRTTLQQTDIFVSTAQHEFFGLAAVEAISAGAYPLLPNRLSYPELLQRETFPDRDHYFYEGDLPSLVSRLGALIEQFSGTGNGPQLDATLSHEMARFQWSVRAPDMDRAIEHLQVS
ncbi:MAG: glycosyltransferase, partial [Pirellulaceae bacterium]